MSISDRGLLKSCRRVDRVIALSSSQKSDIEDLYGIQKERIHIGGSGFDDRLFSYSTKPEPRPVNILYAGKLSRAKGVIWLLESLEHIPDLPFHLYLAGSGIGSEKESCVRLAQSYKTKVTFCGALKQEELAGMMKQAHIFILPSFFEGFPLVLLEALASGCKIITTALGGAKEIEAEVGPERVRLIELPPLETVDAPFEADMPILKKQLADIVRDEIDKTKTQAYVDEAQIRRVTEKYTWKAVFKRIESVYLSL